MITQNGGFLFRGTVTQPRPVFSILETKRKKTFQPQLITLQCSIHTRLIITKEYCINFVSINLPYTFEIKRELYTVKFLIWIRSWKLMSMFLLKYISAISYKWRIYMCMYVPDFFVSNFSIKGFQLPMICTIHGERRAHTFPRLSEEKNKKKSLFMRNQHVKCQSPTLYVLKVGKRSRSIGMTSEERSGHEESVCEILNPYPL